MVPFYVFRKEWEKERKKKVIYFECYRWAYSGSYNVEDATVGKNKNKNKNHN